MTNNQPPAKRPKRTILLASYSFMDILLIMTATQTLNSLDLEIGRCTKRKVLAYARGRLDNGASSENLKAALLRAGCVQSEITHGSVSPKLYDMLTNF